ncbi:MAG: hypothetical protein ACXWA9_13575, partial [Acidimicrobiia bacterium]
ERGTYNNRVSAMVAQLPVGIAEVAASGVHGGGAEAVVVDVVVDDVLVAPSLVRAELLGPLDDEHAAAATRVSVSATTNRARRVRLIGAGIDLSLLR